MNFCRVLLLTPNVEDILYWILQYSFYDLCVQCVYRCKKKSHETPQVDHFSTQCGHHTQLGTRWQMTLILKSSARLGCTYRSRCTFPIGTITIIFIWLMQHEELTGAYGPPKCYKLVSMKINGRLYDHYTQGNFSKKCFMQPISEDFPHMHI